MHSVGRTALKMRNDKQVWWKEDIWKPLNFYITFNSIINDNYDN